MSFATPSRSPDAAQRNPGNSSNPNKRKQPQQNNHNRIITMDKFDRIYALHTLLSNSRSPISKSAIQHKLECSHATVERIIQEMRLYLNAPIEYDRDAKGYYYDKRPATHYELPGLWFNASELHALLTAYHLLTHIEPGILEAHISPLKEKIEKLLHHEKAGNKNINKRIRILKIAARRYDFRHFNIVASALILRKQLTITYLGRQKNKQTHRTVSPQRLIHYRDNWYLDAWCHQKEAFRNFSIDRISESKIEQADTKEFDDRELDRHFASAYGIFAGEPKHTAVLKFTQEVARWVADEQWHPQQNGQYELDGSYLLEIPYSDSRELSRDILKYGADVEVLAPASLRTHVQQQLQKAANVYADR